jgi:hypothetical protein
MKRSDDQLANWIFKMIIDVLNGKSNLSEKAPIKVKFCWLNDKKPKKIGKIYIGVIGETDDPGIEDFWKICIEKRISERSKIRVFLHEMLHVLFWNENRENPILKLEHLLYPKLSEDQKQLLKKFMYSLSKKSA